MTLEDFLSNLYEVVIEPGLLLLFGIAFVVFIWGIVKFIQNADDAGGRDEGKQSIIWGIIGMVIMVSVYGIINITYGTLGGSPSDLPQQNTGPYLPEGAVDSPL